MPKAASSLVQRSASGLSEATAMPQPRPRSARKMPGVSACMRTLRPAASLTSQPPTCHSDAQEHTAQRARSAQGCCDALRDPPPCSTQVFARSCSPEGSACFYPAAGKGAHTRT